MLKCKICGTEFPPLIEKHYICRDNRKVGFAAGLSSNDEEKLYDTFDCPICGCQIVAQDRKQTYRPTKNVDGEKKNA